MLPPGLSNPFSKPRDLDPDTAKMVGDMLGPEARKAFEALDKEPKKPKEKPQELTEQEKAAMRKAEKGLMERSKELLERLPTWKTIRIGRFRNAEFFLNTLKVNPDIMIGDFGEEMVRKITFVKSLTSVELVIIRGSDVGLKKKCTFSEILAAAEACGLSKSPAEAGLELRLQYFDQPEGEDLFVAMEPIANSLRPKDVFNLHHRSLKFWLDSSDSTAEYFVDDQWVFMRGKPTKVAE